MSRPSVLTKEQIVTTFTQRKATAPRGWASGAPRTISRVYARERKPLSSRAQGLFITMINSFYHERTQNSCKRG
ncbi:MAG: hypothetical protein HXK18_01375 [Alloprevotella tannerae]|nr:hypothetical protein [Alloprevotella tannerae]